MTESSGESQCRAWVVGLGTPLGDDRVGWEVAEQLRHQMPAGCRVDAVYDPVLVVEDPHACDVLILVDACRGAGPVGSVHRFDWPNTRLTVGGGVSSHGIGLAAALDLAGVLGLLPPRVVVFGVEGESDGPGTGMSAAVEGAIPEVVARVLRELSR